MEWIAYHTKAIEGLIKKVLLKKEQIKHSSEKSTKYRVLLDTFLKQTSYHLEKINERIRLNPNPNIQKHLCLLNASNINVVNPSLGS